MGKGRSGARQHADRTGGRPVSDRWDDALAAWPRAHLLQSWGWGELQAGAGWRVERLEVAVGARLLPLTVLAGGAALPGLPPSLYIPKGPACAPGDAAALRGVVEAIAALGRRSAAARITVEPNAWYDERPALAAALGDGWHPGHPIQPEHTAIVDLRGGEVEVLARMRPKGRYNIRLAEKRGVTVRTPTDPAEAAAAMTRLSDATARRQGISLPTHRYFRRLLDCVPTARVHLAVVEGEAVAAILVAHFAGELIYLYGGSEARHRERQPSALLHMHAIREAIAAGCDRYDLWGVPPSTDPGHPWHGLRQFKLALGGVERSTAGAYSWVRRPVAARATVAVGGARRAVARLRRRTMVRVRQPDGAVQSRAEQRSTGET